VHFVGSYYVVMFECYWSHRIKMKSHVRGVKAYGGVDLQRCSLQTEALNGGFVSLHGKAALLPGK
jgi:hypothetical protein